MIIQNPEAGNRLTGIQGQSPLQLVTAHSAVPVRNSCEVSENLRVTWKALLTPEGCHTGRIEMDVSYTRIKHLGRKQDAGGLVFISKGIIHSLQMY